MTSDPTSNKMTAYTFSGEGMIRAIEGDVRRWYSAEDVEQLLARAYNRLQCADVPRDPWHWEVSGMLSGDSSAPETSPHLSAAELLIPATRYYMGRMTIHTTVHAQALARNWRSIPQNVRNVIRTDLEDAFRRDDAMRADPVCSPSYYPLGGDVDREAWEEVRKAWLADPSVVETSDRCATAGCGKPALPDGALCFAHNEAINALERPEKASALAPAKCACTWYDTHGAHSADCPLNGSVKP